VILNQSHIIIQFGNFEMAVPILDFGNLEAAVRSLKVPELGAKRTNPVG
jgi:hypothetical protein